MRLVDSSEPGAVSRDEAWWLLHERAVLTAAVCQELLECPDEDFTERRPRAALDLLRRWVAQRDDATGETHPSDGLHQMVVPPGAADLVEEIRLGARVCEDLAMLWTADTDTDLARDAGRVRESLHRWERRVSQLRRDARARHAASSLGHYALRLVRRFPDRSIDRWTIVGEPGQWNVAFRPSSGYDTRSFRSDLDTVAEVVGDTPDLNRPDRGAIHEFTVRDDVDITLLLQSLIPDATQGAEAAEAWPDDLSRRWATSAPEWMFGLPWVDRWVSINDRRLSALWAAGDCVLAPCNADGAELHAMVEAMRESRPYRYPSVPGPDQARLDS